MASNTVLWPNHRADISINWALVQRRTAALISHETMQIIRSRRVLSSNPEFPKTHFCLLRQPRAHRVAHVITRSTWRKRTSGREFTARNHQDAPGSGTLAATRRSRYKHCLADFRLEPTGPSVTSDRRGRSTYAILRPRSSVRLSGRQIDLASDGRSR